MCNKNGLHILKCNIIRATLVNSGNIILKNEHGEREGDQELITQIGKVCTLKGELDLNQYAIGRVQYLLENRLNID